MSNDNKQPDAIISYTLQEAIEDGVLVKIFENRWPELTHGKPMIATTHLFEEISLAAFQEIWNEYVIWKTKVMPTLKEEDQMFVTKMNGKDIWVIDDGATYTFMFPSDY